MAFYPVGTNDRVVELTDLPVPDPGAANVRLDATAYSTVLQYSAAGESGRVAVTINACSQLQFGWPNDEVAYAHPLYGRGLGPYGVYEVIPSGWLAALAAANAIHPGHQTARFANKRHLIFMLHDKTFECLADGYTFVLDPSDVI